MATNKEDARRKLEQMFRGVKASDGAVAAPLAASSMAAARGGEIGALRGETAIIIQSRQAQILLTGREPSPGRNGVMGLMQFSRYLVQITAAAKQDDPWADWVLVLVEEKLEAAGTKLAEMQGNVDRVLGSNPMIDIQVSESLKPLRVAIGFASPHAYWVARTITQYDAVVRAVLTARHHALITPDMGNLLMDDAARLVRRVFEATARYRATGITRADVAAGDGRVAAAEEKMGRVPVEILDGTKQAKFAPAAVAAQMVGTRQGGDPPMVGEVMAEAEKEVAAAV